MLKFKDKIKILQIQDATHLSYTRFLKKSAEFLEHFTITSIVDLIFCAFAIYDISIFFFFVCPPWRTGSYILC